MGITEKRIKELERAEAKLHALEAGGVDNWDNYDDSLEEYRATIELDERREELIEELSAVFSECAYEPFERGVGIAFVDKTQDEAMQVLERFGVVFNKEVG